MIDYTVRQIPASMTHEWIIKKHYAHRLPPISYSFGLYDKAYLLQGVCTFGIPASRFAFPVQPYELNRLVISEGLEKNICSFFISHCLKQMPKPSIVVSYADANQGHHGYIYQATNWLYTGISTAEDDIFIDGQQLHRKTLYNVFGTSSLPSLRNNHDVTSAARLGKFRYFYIVADKREFAKYRQMIPYDILPYPKGDNHRYDASYEPPNQGVLL